MDHQEEDFNGGEVEDADEIYEINAPITLRSYPSDYSEPPALSYSYSGISNSSSSHDIHMQSSRISEEPDHFTFFQADQMYNSILKLVNEVHESLALDLDIVLYILYFYKWNKERLYQEYYDQATSFQDKNTRLQDFKPQPSKGQCRICCEEKQLLKNPLCVHRYCWECWNGYIEDQLKHGQVFFGCMDGCKQCPVLPNSLIFPCFPKQAEIYRKMACINYSKFNRDISYCPGGIKACNYFCQAAEGAPVNIVQCLCGNFYCFRCQKQPHFPATCADVDKWEQVLNNEEGSINWISQNTVKCPSCGALVNKYIGCSYVKCVCGSEFCYNCSQKWDEAHKLSKGQCLRMRKKSSLKERTTSNSFMELQEKIMAINRTMLRHTQIILEALALIKEEWVLAKFHGVRRDIAEAWYTLKWGLIAQFLYKKEPVDQFIQEEFLNSITSLMDSLERAHAQGRSINLKDLVQLGDQVAQCREVLSKNETVWLDAWRNC